MKTLLRIGYTPDPDDAFHYYALEKNKIALSKEYSFKFYQGHIRDLNEMALMGIFDVCAISSIFYPKIDKDYAILSSGASVGRGYGPVLGCKKGKKITSLAGKKVGVPGCSTTGYFLLRYFYQDFEVVNLPFDAIADAIESEEVDAGVLIHEELLNYTQRTIDKVCCLGNKWYQETHLPLPVGLNVVRRDLGEEKIKQIQEMVQASMVYALKHPVKALKFASHFGRGPKSIVRNDFVKMFANEDTLSMPEDVLLGLKTLYLRAYQRKLIDYVPQQDIVFSQKERDVEYA